MSAFIDTNVLVRHLTGDPVDMAERATRFLGEERDLLLADLVVAETVYVLESFYETPREQPDSRSTSQAGSIADQGAPAKPPPPEPPAATISYPLGR